MDFANQQYQWLLRNPKVASALVNVYLIACEVVQINRKNQLPRLLAAIRLCSQVIREATGKSFPATIEVEAEVLTTTTTQTTTGS